MAIQPNSTGTTTTGMMTAAMTGPDIPRPPPRYQLGYTAHPRPGRRANAVPGRAGAAAEPVQARCPAGLAVRRNRCRHDARVGWHSDGYAVRARFRVRVRAAAAARPAADTAVISRPAACSAGTGPLVRS